MTYTMPMDLIAKIIWYCTPVDVEAGELILRRGDTTTDLYIITRGKFRVFDDSRNEDFLLAILERGSVFGEMAFLDGLPRSATIESVTDGSLLRLGEQEFNRMALKAPETSVRFLRALSGIVCRRLRVMNDALAGVAFSSGPMSREQEQELLNTIRAMHQSVKVELEEEV